MDKGYDRIGLGRISRIGKFVIEDRNTPKGV